MKLPHTVISSDHNYITLMWPRLSLANQNRDIFLVGTIFYAFYEQRLNFILSFMQYAWCTVTL